MLIDCDVGGGGGNQLLFLTPDATAAVGGRVCARHNFPNIRG